MRYTVVLEPTREPDQPGWFYAHISSLDLTTHGLGIEGAMTAAKELVDGSVAELSSRGETIPVEDHAFVSQIEVGNHALHGS